MEGFPVQTMKNLAAPFIYGPNDNAEKVALSMVLPAGILVPGCKLAVRGGGLITTVAGSPELDVRLRLGPTTLTGAILGKHNDGSAPAADLTWRIFNGNNQTNAPFWFQAETTVQANGTDTTTTGLMVAVSGTSFNFGALPVQETALVAIDPSVDNLLELTLDWDDNAANIVNLKNAQFGMEWSQ